MLKVLFFSLIISIFGCGNVIETTEVKVSEVTPNPSKSPTKCSIEKEEIKNVFNGLGLDESEYERGEELLRKLRDCPKNEVISSIKTIQKNNSESIEITAKTLYLLIKIEDNEIENGKSLVSTYLMWGKELQKHYKDPNYDKNLEKGLYDEFNRFDGSNIIYLLYDLIENDNQIDLLSDTLDLSTETDGASAELISEIFGKAFIKNPTYFLQKLKPKSNKIRQQTYAFLFYSIPKDKVFQHLTPIPKDSEVYSLFEEIQKFAKNIKDNN